MSSVWGISDEQVARAVAAIERRIERRTCTRAEWKALKLVRQRAELGLPTHQAILQRPLLIGVTNQAVMPTLRRMSEAIVEVGRRLQPLVDAAVKARREADRLALEEEWRA